MTDALQLDFCKVSIYNNYIIVVIDEGITLIPQHNNVLLNIIDTYFVDKKFVYITHRIHSYSVNPAIYRETSKIANLVGFAVVTKDYKAKGTAEIEKIFLSKPFAIFDEIKEAVNWSESLLQA